MDKIIVLALIAASIFPMPSNADSQISVAELVGNLKSSDGKVIQLRGFYFADLMQVPHLYASRDDALGDKEFDAIDLIFDDNSLQLSIKDTDPVCLTLKGTFNTYDHGHILIGLISKYGVLHVQSFERCGSSQ